MNILYATFGSLHVGTWDIRSVAMLRALGDAGHQVDLIAASTDIGYHPNIQILTAPSPEKRLSFGRLRREMVRAIKRKRYDVVHAVDEAALHVARMNRVKRSGVVYEAYRCFSGPNGEAPAGIYRLFPARCARLEAHLLRRADVVLSSNAMLSSDLKQRFGDVNIVHLEDVPAHPFFPLQGVDRSSIVEGFEGGISFLVAVSVMSGNKKELKTLMLAVRKVLEKVPRAGFFFKGVDSVDAEQMLVNLDIGDRCRFLPDNLRLFLDVLSLADAVLFVPRPQCRYPHPEIMTLMNSHALVVAVKNGAYSELLTEENSLLVNHTATSISEGLLRVVQEPLFSFVAATEAQRMVADRYSFSSFKHRLRMVYHELGSLH